MPQNKLSPWVQALLALGLLAMFAGVLFLPAFIPAYKIEADIKQTLFALVTAVVFFFIGKNTDTAGRDAAITQAAISSIPAAPVAPLKVDDSTPIAVTPVPAPVPTPATPKKVPVW